MTSRSLSLVLAVVLVGPATAAPPVPDAIDVPMNQDPAIPVSEAAPAFPAGLLDLWVKALDRPESDTVCRAATAIALAHSRGLTEATTAAPALVRALERPARHPTVRVAVAKTLVALDARDAAPKLFAHLRTEGVDYREVVETALAAWDHRPARAVWLDRLTATPLRHDRDLLRAVRSLATVREDGAAARLRDLALNTDLPAATRIEAARAVVRLRPAVSEADAAPVPADVTAAALPTRLVTVTLLRQRSDDAAVKLLQAFAGDAEPAVALVAATRLLELDPKHVLAVLEPALASADFGMRLVAVEALFKLPSADHIRRLGDRLDDPHPDVRVKARLRLRQLSGSKEWTPTVTEQAVRAVQSDGWRPQEQGAMLLAQLGDTGRMSRLVELLKSDRPEVMVAAGWAVRVLAVPDTFPAVLTRVTARREQAHSKGLRFELSDGIDGQLTQLLQLFGTVKYREADAELRRLYPRFLGRGDAPAYNPRGASSPPFNLVGGEPRAAALWALGRLYENAPDAALAKRIEERLTGDPGLGPDHPAVRRMAAVALGQMRANESATALAQESGRGLPTLDPVPHACRWAVARLTGAAPPPPGRVEVPQVGWFLTPAK